MIEGSAAETRREQRGEAPEPRLDPSCQIRCEGRGHCGTVLHAVRDAASAGKAHFGRPYSEGSALIGRQGLISRQSHERLVPLWKGASPR